MCFHVIQTTRTEEHLSACSVGHVAQCFVYVVVLLHPRRSGPSLRTVFQYTKFCIEIQKKKSTFDLWENHIVFFCLNLLGTLFFALLACRLCAVTLLIVLILVRAQSALLLQGQHQLQSLSPLLEQLLLPPVQYWDYMEHNLIPPLKKDSYCLHISLKPQIL